MTCQYTPRPYQEKLLADCRRKYAAGAKSVLAVSPTGSGKTVFGRMVVEGALARGLRILWGAHRRELVKQAAAKMPGRVGVIMAGRTSDTEAPTQVASLDTLTERGDLPAADLFVFDEAHHAVAESYSALLARYPNIKILGLTATPGRADGTPLGDVFDAMVIGPSMRTLIDLGFLVECDVIAPANYDDALAAGPVEAWLAHSGGLPGFMFAKTKKHSRDIVAGLIAAGVPAAHVDSDTPKGQRDKAIADFENGRIDVLSSVDVFTEGTDLPRAKCVCLARDCKQPGNYLQKVGRVLRPYNGLSARMIDLFGVVWKHGLPEADREWSLSGKPIRLAKGEPPISQCPSCAGVMRAGLCRRCQYRAPAPETPPIEERELIDARRAGPRAPQINAPASKKNADLARWREEAAAKNYSPKWASIRFKTKYGHWPKGPIEEGTP